MHRSLGQTARDSLGLIAAQIISADTVETNKAGLRVTFAPVPDMASDHALSDEARRDTRSRKRRQSEVEEMDTPAKRSKKTLHKATSDRERAEEAVWKVRLFQTAKVLHKRAWH